MEIIEAEELYQLCQNYTTAISEGYKIVGAGKRFCFDY